MSKKLYLVGPMRGLPLLNFPAFEEATTRLRAAGYEVTSPHEKDVQAGYSEHVQRPLVECGPEDVALVLASDVIALLPNWEKSRMGRVEVLTALAADRPIEIIDAMTLTPVTDAAARMARVILSPSDVSTPGDGSNPKDKLGSTKPQLHLVPPALTIWTAKAMEFGAEKYGPYNWRQKKVRMTVYLSAALRHLSALLDGENIAEDSQCPHEAHLAACMGILLDARATGNLIDDRPTPGAASRLLEQLTKKPENEVVAVDFKAAAA
jgi:hypothetical protein